MVDVVCVSLMQVILTVYLNDTQQMLTEVPITPATRVTDVVEYCKEAGEGECHLAEVWNGHGESLQSKNLCPFIRGLSRRVSKHRSKKATHLPIMHKTKSEQSSYKNCGFFQKKSCVCAIMRC